MRKLPSQWEPHFNNLNLHRIAISNLRDGERQVIRWWCNKYRTPAKPLGEHTLEELMIEMLEDYYAKHPQEIERFFDSVENVEWDGTTTPEYELEIQKRIKRLGKKAEVDLKQFQDDKEMSDAEYQKMLAELGKDLPGSKKKAKASEAEFDDNFLGSE